MTLTNVNFDPEAIAAYIKKTPHSIKNNCEARLYAVKVKVNSPFNLKLEKTTAAMIPQGKQHGVNSDTTVDIDLHLLQWFLTFGLKGVAAYAFHAALLGKKDQKVFDFINQVAAPLDKSLGVNEFFGLVFKCGEINIRAMELLDAETPKPMVTQHRQGCPWDTDGAKPSWSRDMTSSI